MFLTRAFSAARSRHCRRYLRMLSQLMGQMAAQPRNPEQAAKLGSFSQPRVSVPSQTPGGGRATLTLCCTLRLPTSVKPYRTPVSGSLALRLHVSVMLIKATLQMHTSHMLACAKHCASFKEPAPAPRTAAFYGRDGPAWEDSYSHRAGTENTRASSPMKGMSQRQKESGCPFIWEKRSGLPDSRVHISQL